MNNNEKLAKIAVNKSLVKEFSNSSEDRIVYLNDGTEFQIQIFNPYTYTISVAFDFNDETSWIYSNLLVIRPGERIWVDRYLNENKKLLFSTYNVNNSKDVQNAIKNNGNLNVKFFKEYEKNYTLANNILTVSNDDFNIKKFTYYDAGDFKTNVNNCVLGPNEYNCSASLDTFGATLGLSAITEGTTVSTYCAQTATVSTPKMRSKTVSKNIETGRIEKGRYSNQNFKHVNMDFCSLPFKTETIHIYPASRKPMTSSDLTKKYCYNCGRKLTNKFKYCPFCGAKQ